MNQLISKIVEDYLKGDDSVSQIVALYGDASYRRYFRALLDSGKSLIVMKMPDGASSVSEEITNYRGSKGEPTYINVSRYLGGLGVMVPEILQYNKENEAIILEDVGDQLLFDLVLDANEKDLRLWYRRAIDLLVSLQNKVDESQDCIAYERSFDETLLNWEFDHFLEYGIEARLGKKIGSDFRVRFKKATRSLSKEIFMNDYIFVHRDFQSRNIMIKGEGLYLIDFQDALLGPMSYDLVALLRDSYVELSDELLDEMIAYYCDLSGFDLDTFREQFDLLTIQRKLKDAGRFVYIDQVKGNPNYLKYIPTSLNYVKRALERNPKYNDFLHLLKPYISEW